MRRVSIYACLCECARACDRWVERRAQCAAGLSRLFCRFSRFIAAAAGPSSVARDVAPVRVRRRMVTMMEESDSIPCSAEDGLLSSWRWNRTARDQVQIKQKIRDLPGLLKHGLNLRKKTVSYQLSRPLESINKTRTMAKSNWHRFETHLLDFIMSLIGMSCIFQSSYLRQQRSSHTLTYINTHTRARAHTHLLWLHFLTCFKVIWLWNIFAILSW